MKKNVIFILVILFIIIFPVVAWATNKVAPSNILKSENDINIDYSKLEYSEDEFLENRREKKEMQEEYLANSAEKVKSNTELRNDIIELENKMKEKDEEIIDNMQYIIEIVRIYYPNEIDKILKEAEIEEKDMNNSGVYIAISKAECKLINLIVNILEEENIEEDVSNTLKEYISNQDFKLKEVGELELIKKIQNVLNIQ